MTEDDEPEKRFKSLRAMNLLAKNNRRPPSDVATLLRSTQVCGELAQEIETALAKTRLGLTEIKLRVNNWRAPEIPAAEPEPPKKPRTAAQLAHAARLGALSTARKEAKEAKEREAVPV